MGGTGAAMTYEQPNVAPESCRAPLCGYLEIRSRGGEQFDRCLHNIPQHEGCAWHRTPEQIRAMHERDAQMLHQINAPIRRRGL